MPRAFASAKTYGENTADDKEVTRFTSYKDLLHTEDIKTNASPSHLACEEGERGTKRFFSLNYKDYKID